MYRLENFCLELTRLFIKISFGFNWFQEIEQDPFHVRKIWLYLIRMCCWLTHWIFCVPFWNLKHSRGHMHHLLTLKTKSLDALVYELGSLSGVTIAHLHSNHSAMIKMTNELLIQVKQDLALYWKLLYHPHGYLSNLVQIPWKSHIKYIHIKWDMKPMEKRGLQDMMFIFVTQIPWHVPVHFLELLHYWNMFSSFLTVFYVQ